MPSTKTSLIRLIVWSLFISTLSCGLPLAAQDFLSQGNAIIQQVDADNQLLSRQLEQSMANAALALERSAQQLLKPLKRPQDDKSIAAITELMTKLRTLTTGLEVEEAIRTAPIPLESGFHGAIATYQDQVLTLNHEFSVEFEKIRQRNIREIRASIQNMRKRQNSLGATHLEQFLWRFLAIENPAFNRQCPSLPNDPKEAEIVWERTKKEWGVEFRAVGFRQLRDVLVKLESSYLKAKKEQNQDAMQLLDRLADQLIQAPHPDEPLKWAQENVATKFPDFMIAFDDYVQWRNLRIAEDKKLSQELDDKWAILAAEILKEKLAAGLPLDDARREIRGFLKLKGQKVDWLSSWSSSELPRLNGESAALLADFDREATERVKVADAQDAAHRGELLAKLQANPFLEEDLQSTYEKLIGELTSKYAAGLQGTWLLSPDPKLKPADLAALKLYLQKSDAAYEQLKNDHAQALKGLRSKFGRFRKESLAKPDFIGFQVYDEHLHTREFPPMQVWVRSTLDNVKQFNRMTLQYSNVGKLIAKQNDQYLVADAHDGRNPRWFPRGQVCLGWSDFSESREQVFGSAIMFRRYDRAFNHPPSHGWDGKENLPIGAELIVFNERDWVPATLVDYCSIGCVVSMPTFDDTPRYGMMPQEFVRVVDK